MAKKRVSSCPIFEDHDENLKRVFRTYNEVDSPPTSDLYEPDEQEGEASAATEIIPRTGSEIASSELYEPRSDEDDDDNDETMILSPNSSELLEPLVSSESDVRPAFSSEMQQGRDNEDLGCFPLSDSDEESSHLTSPGKSK